MISARRLAALLLFATLAGVSAQAADGDIAAKLNKRECTAQGGYWSPARKCSGPLKGMPLEMTPDMYVSITSALSDDAGEPVEITHATRERRKDEEVICGLYATRGQKAENIVRPFSWADGRLIMKWGPDWNIGTVCLISNYHMPLP